jgi:PAS domain S-box-containing protein
MTANPVRKLSLIPMLLGLFFLLFVIAATTLLVQPASPNPFLVLSVVGMAMVGVYAMKKLLGRAREAELSLGEGERYIEAVAELSQDVHAILDVDSRAFLYLNPAMENLLGYSLDTCFKGGLDFLDSLVHPEDLQVRIRQDEELLAPLKAPLGPGEGEAVQDQLFRIRNHHGDYRWFKARRTVFVRHPDGRPMELLEVFQDITEARASQAALVQSQRMESLAAMTRGSVHDLSNTLMGIQGFSDMALETAEDAEALKRHLEKLQQAIQRASALCRQMLGFTGQGRVQISPHSMDQTVKECLPAIENLVPQGGTLLLELKAGRALASLDLGQVRSALLILAFNAAESIRTQGGEITVLTCAQTLDGLSPLGLRGEFVCVEVRDTGAPKPPEVLQKICDPLFSTLFPGQGLGLSAVNGLVKEHHGGLTAVNLPGTGCATRLYFPLAQAVPKLDEGDEGTPVVGAAGVVLVVDDEPSIRNILRVGLESEGFNVIEAEDGAEGLAAFMRHRSSISIVLLDWTMPRMGGDEVLAELRKVAPNQPVVLMSGYSEEEVMAALPREAVLGFLSKPCSVKDAVAVVQRALAIRAN